MKAIVKKHLNLRLEKPSVNAPNPSFFNPGEIVEVVDTVTGDLYKGSNVWFKLSNGGFIWSGGIADSENIQSLIHLPQPKVQVNYNNAFTQVPADVRNTNGRKVKIAVLDTGADLDHEAFLKSIQKDFNASGSPSGTRDVIGHGTHCLGLIGARNAFADKGVMGVAPEAELFIAKVATDDDIFTMANVVNGLTWAIETIKADIISMSFSIIDFKEADKTEFNRLLSKAKAGNQVLIAAAGENELLLSSFFDEFFYPAMADDCISVGAVDETIFRHNTLKFNKRLNYIMPFRQLYSAVPGSGLYNNKRGSSMSTALMAGIAGLFISSKTNAGNNRQFLIDQLDRLAQPLTKPSDLTSPFKIFKP
jgi:subtilisin